MTMAVFFPCASKRSSPTAISVVQGSEVCTWCVRINRHSSLSEGNTKTCLWPVALCSGMPAQLTCSFIDHFRVGQPFYILCQSNYVVNDCCAVSCFLPEEMRSIDLGIHVKPDFIEVISELQGCPCPQLTLETVHRMNATAVFIVYLLWLLMSICL